MDESMDIAQTEDMYDEQEVDAVEQPSSTADELATDSVFVEIKNRIDAGEELSDADLDLIADTSVEILRSILVCFNEGAANIDEYEGDLGELILDVSGGNLAVLIGRHGRTLEALQQIVTALINTRLGFHYPVIVDIEGYKDRRRQKLQSMAHNMAAKAKRQHKSQRLAAMNAYERRIIHLALSGDTEVTTYSEGEDPNRYVVIMPV